MARDLQYAESLGESTTLLPAYQDKVSLAFTPPATQPYLILAGFDANNSLAGTWTGFVRLTLAGASEHDWIEQQDVASQYQSALLMKVITLTPALQTFKVQFGSSGHGATQRIRNAKILAVALAGPWWSAAQEAEVLTAGTGYTNVVSVATSGIVNATEVLVLAFWEAKGAVAGVAGQVRVRNTTDGVTLTADPLGTAGASYATWCGVAWQTISANKNYTIQFSGGPTSVPTNVRKARIVVLPLADALISEHFKALSDGDSISTSPTPASKLIHSFTPSQAGRDWWVLGSIEYTASDPADDVGLRDFFDGSVQVLHEADLPIGAGGRRLATGFLRKHAALTAANHSSHWQFYRVAGSGTVTVSRGRLLALQLQMGAQSYSETVALAAAAALAPGSVAAFGSTFALEAASTVGPGQQTSILRTTTLTADAALAQSFSFVYGVLLSLGVQAALALVTVAQLFSTRVETAAAFITMAGGFDLAATRSFDAVVNLSWFGAPLIPKTLGLSAAAGLTPLPTTLIAVRHTLSAIADLAPFAGTAMARTLALDVLADLQTRGGFDSSHTLALAAAAGFATTEMFGIGGAVALGASAGIAMSGGIPWSIREPGGGPWTRVGEPALHGYGEGGYGEGGYGGGSAWVKAPNPSGGWTKQD